MTDAVNWKLVLAIIATIINIVAYFPYFKDIFAQKTKPHLYTWIIWAITQGTATVALIYGGGKFGAISLVVGVLLVVAIIILSFKYGTKDITKTDTVTLIVALIAIVVWWQFNNPLLSVIMVSLIDGLGYIPTLRKSYKDPYSETISFWVMMMSASFISLLANAEYNWLTVTYLAVLVVMNMTVAVLCTLRRRSVVGLELNN